MCIHTLSCVSMHTRVHAHVHTQAEAITLTVAQAFNIAFEKWQVCLVCVYLPREAVL